MSIRITNTLALSWSNECWTLSRVRENQKKGGTYETPERYYGSLKHALDAALDMAVREKMNQATVHSLEDIKKTLQNASHELQRAVRGAGESLLRVPS